jgi:hypothetical protein
MNTLEELLSIVERYRSESDRSFPNGARLVCPVPWIAPSAWLHHIMAPCPEEAIERLAPTTGRQPPAVVIEFLRMANGIRLFNGSISVFGVRGDFSRKPETAHVLPFDIAFHTRDWSHLFGSDDFLVGSIGDADPCVWKSPNGEIHRLSREGGEVLERWPSFHDWLVPEADRFASMHEPTGRLVQPLALERGKSAPRGQESLSDIKPTFLSPAWWWDVEDRLRLPSNTLPFYWIEILWTKLLLHIAKWLDSLANTAIIRKSYLCLSPISVISRHRN